MPTPLDPRFRTVLEAVATAADAYDLSDMTSADICHRLLEVVDTAFPGRTWTATAARIREALAACPTAGPRTPEDVRTDPQPGDTFTDARGDVYTVAVRHRNYVVYDNPAGDSLGCSVVRWSSFPGTFTPAP